MPTRSQAESFVRLGKVRVNGTILTKPGTLVSDEAEVKLLAKEQYVSRAGLKLASVAKALRLDFKGKTVLDVGSSTGGFTDYALQHGAQKVYAVDVGTDQLHPSLRGDERVELYEQTDIRQVRLRHTGESSAEGGERKRLTPHSPLLSSVPDIIVIDVSFISLREILPHIATLCGPGTSVVAMCKPQFEAGSGSKHKGIIKNDRMRRDILKDFEQWLKQYFITLDKADSEVAGAKGNRERFYLLRLASI